jgi:hypothetical protein
MICPVCHGERYEEREGPNGPYEIPCTHCYESLGEVNDNQDDEGQEIGQ